ncbi:copper-translocating P-type ATPase [Sulfoacidibacillus thermotolerans]|uniref:P-type Cu(+) transporter n=2 Tax=Sulfoacidibacillus thermotolerans TaxID=1765684 RepID=A0A2U3D9C1_SULT2|nr:copper-translocating P-type ATPase [Sulfoacidibacillus thermotolerans]
MCGQTVRLPIPSGHHVFCCHGCKELYEVLGEQQVAILKQQPGLRLESIKKESANAQAPSLLQAIDPQRTAFRIEGITCPSCAILIEQVLLRQHGVISAKLDFTESIAEIALDASCISKERVQAEIEKLGYTAHSVIETEEEDFAGAKLLRRFLLALILTAIMMMLSVPIWSEYLPQFPHALRTLVVGFLLGLTSIVLFYSGWPFLRGALASLHNRIPTMDLLVSIGSIAAYGYSVASLLTTQRFLYFDTVGLLITFLLLSRNLEYAARLRALQILHVAKRLIPEEMQVLQNGEIVTKRVEHVLSGEHFVCGHGEVVPVDARLIEGAVLADESILTGEAKRVEKGVRDLVYAGSRLFGERAVLEVVRSTQTLLEQTAQYVRMAQAKQSHWKRLADRILQVFVPFVFAMGLLTFLYWDLIRHIDFATALLRAIAVLVIGCPCALSIATPLAILNGAKKLASLGVLLRSPDALERAGQIQAVVFDKTGTITTGRLSVFDYLPKERSEIFKWIASAELPSEHPIADAFVRKAKELGLTLYPVTSFKELTSWGIQAVVEGRTLQVGASVTSGVVPCEWDAVLARWRTQGLTIVYAVMNGEVFAAISLSDELRTGVLPLIRELKGKGIELAIASGDSESATSLVAQRLEVQHFYARQTALQKADLICSFKNRGIRVAFVGDGVNDSPALVEADLGIALGSSPDIALEAGHLVLAHNDIQAISRILTTARLTFTVIRQNLLWAISYNLLAQLLAVTGIASPALAALAMMLSSVFVLGNSLRVSDFSVRHYLLRVTLIGSFGVVLWLLAFYRV